MKSKEPFVLLIKMGCKYGVIVLLLLTYLVNLTPDHTFRSELDHAEKSEVFFDESDPGFSFDTEVDLIDESLAKVLYSNPFLVASTEQDKKQVIDPQSFFAVYLEILIPPPRLNS